MANNRFTNSVTAAAMSLQVSPHVLQAFLEPMRSVTAWDREHPLGEGERVCVSVNAEKTNGFLQEPIKASFNGECIKG